MVGAESEEFLDGDIARVIGGAHQRRDSVLVFHVDGDLEVGHQHADDGGVAALGSLQLNV